MVESISSRTPSTAGSTVSGGVSGSGPSKKNHIFKIIILGDCA